MTSLNAATLWGPLIVEYEVEPDLIESALWQGNKSKGKEELNARKDLAGVIDSQYHLQDYNEWFSPDFSKYVQMYVDALSAYSSSSFDHISYEPCSLLWNLDSLWINYQRRGEYNPPHVHSATKDISFILYLRVPSEISKEYESGDSRNNQGPGAVCFSYGEALPFNICNYSRLPYNGLLIMFPTWVTHHAISFNSDVERISVSGNISVGKNN
tara:strand:+ start:196 stop:834 length:639 start_codon:yes stop_codon:yes gene_type:complete